MTPVGPLRRLAALGLLGGALGGCLNLELPNLPPDGGVGPTLTIHSPRAGDTIPLDAPVSLDADSVNGVASVTVGCGGEPSTGVFTWNVPPYTGVIDFTRCTLLATGVTDAGVGQLQLTFTGVDTLGHASHTSFQVFLDTSTATLSATLPARVVPKDPLLLTVASNRPLLLPPTVRLAGKEADGIAQRANPDGGPPFYDVTFSQTPGIGIDEYTGDPFNVPFEVLSDVERSVGLTIDARATNGNSSHLEQNVLLSRVVWERLVPGRVANAAAAPVATLDGLGVALATVDTNPTATSDWLPGFFVAGDGTYVPFDPTSLNYVGGALGTAVPVDGGLPVPDGGFLFSPDGGFVALDFDARGHTLFARPSQTQRGMDYIATDVPRPPDNIRNAAAYASRIFLTQPFTRTDDLLCVPQPAPGGLCAPTQQGLGCFAAADGGTFVTLAPGALPVGYPTTGSTAGSPGSQRTYLAPNDEPQTCGQAFSFFALPSPANPAGIYSAVPRAVSPNCSETAVDRLLPLADGRFVLGLSLSCGTIASFPSSGAFQVSTTGGLSVYALGVLGTTRSLLAGLPDGTVVTFRNTPPFTTFEQWGLTDTTPRATATVPGLYVYNPTPPRLPDDLSVADDGSFTVLLNSATFGDVLLHFAPGLKAQWIYRYPRIVLTPSALVSAGNLGTVYYVDQTNNVVVALKRF